MSIYLTLIVEDQLSEAVARRILDQTNREYQVVRALRRNNVQIKALISGINQASKSHVHFVLTDQDTVDKCPPNEIRELPEKIHHNLLYRFAVMETESWVMAHRKAFANLLSIPLSKIPPNTDKIPDPKQHLIGLAKKSRFKEIREDIVPRKNSINKKGPAYNSTLGKFVMEKWDVTEASKHSPSLHRTYQRLINFTPK